LILKLVIIKVLLINKATKQTLGHQNANFEAGLNLN